MKTLTAVVVLILLAITAGGVSGYFLYTNLVNDSARIIVKQQIQLDQQSADIQTLQKEIDVQSEQINQDTKQLNRDTEALGAVIEVLNKVFTSSDPKEEEHPSTFDNSMTNCIMDGTCVHSTSGN